MPFWRSPATSRPRCQGRMGFAFTGAKRTPLTEEAGGLGAVFPREGQGEENSLCGIHEGLRTYAAFVIGYGDENGEQSSTCLVRI